MKKILSIFFMMLSLSVVASPVDELETYYRHKSWYLAQNIIQDCSNRNILENKPNSAAGIEGFIIGLLIENPQNEQKLISLNLSPKMRQTIVQVQLSLQHSNKKLSYYTASNNITNAADLDRLWGIFFATGNEQIPEGIRLFVEQEKYGASSRDISKRITVEAAKWSLQSLAQQHPIVKKSWNKMNK